MQVEHRKRFAGEDHLVVVQPDGTLALIPSWMSEETARSATLSVRPRLPVERLVELRVRIDALLASRSGVWPPREGGDHATKTPPATGPVREGSQDAGYSDVAEGHPRPPDPGLLVEAISGASSETRVASTQTKEVAHEQDHA